LYTLAIYDPSFLVHNIYMTEQVTPRPKRQYRRLFIREWRKHRGLTLQQLADRIGTTHATLSRLERGLQPYSQGLLEAIADALMVDVADLHVRDPSDPDGIWSIWELAKPAQRRQIVEIARTLLATGT